MKKGSILRRLWNWFLVLIALVLSGFMVIIPLTWQEQAFVGLATLALVIVLNRISKGQVITITMMALSAIATTRYAYFRIQQTVEGMTTAGHASSVNNFFVIILLFAETYAFMTLYLGHFQTIRPLHRRPAPLPDDSNDWPTIDVYVPTYNEPLYVVRPTVLAALNMDWPSDKFHVYILDDGRREEFRQFSAAAGCGYITRTQNNHAKAGNINQALTQTTGDFIAIFDCDHIPTRSFLQITMGWFLKDKRLGMLQTPHHFYSPDPFEKNLGQFRKMPNEGELFYGIVQDGNDFWNATFFCGSCAVLRRPALLEIGGVAVETVTEDCHTALRMHINQWNTAYINIPQAAGLATESLSSHIGQRIRWARGMVQILRLENPLFNPKLTLAQRFCYFNACSHFLYALPRLIFLTAPLVYLLFGWVNIYGYAWAIFAYAMPHILLAQITNSRVQGHYRLSFWNEIYEAVLAPYILYPTILALINPKLGKFNVTAKGGLVPKSYFDRKIAMPFLVLLFFNILGLIVGIPRYLYWDTAHHDTVIMNVFWTAYNIVILLVSAAVAWETKQQRRHVRVAVEVPFTIGCQDGNQIHGNTVDLSNSGAALHVTDSARALKMGEPISFYFSDGPEGCFFEPRIVHIADQIIRIDFGELNLEQEEVLTRVLYSRADSWIDWGKHREEDRPLRTYARLLGVALQGMFAISRGLFTARPDDPSSGDVKIDKTRRRQPVLILVLIILGLILLVVHRAPARTTAHQKANTPASTKNLPTEQGAVSRASGEFHDQFDLRALGQQRPIPLRGSESRSLLNFSVPLTKVVSSSTLMLRYSAPPQLRSQELLLNITLNNTVIASIEVTPGNNVSALVTVPPELLTTENTLAFQLSGQCSACLGGDGASPWTTIGVGTELSLNGTRLPIANELRLLPQPFFDRSVQRVWSLAFVLPANPDNTLLAAAGVVASKFGELSDFRGVQFTVSRDQLTPGNCVIITTLGSPLLQHFDVQGIHGPAIAMRNNPIDPYGKVLLILGTSSEQALTAARSFASGEFSRNGDTAFLSASKDFSPAAAYSAPRWHSNERPSGMGEYTTQESLRVYGSGSVDLYFRLPPDLYYIGRSEIPIQLKYQFGGVEPGTKGELAIRLNGVFIGSIRLKPEGVGGIHSDRVMLPVHSLNPYYNTITADFLFEGNASPANPQYGQILRETQLELQNVRHSTMLPKLELFSQAGYPFTTHGDLSDSVVVMPNNPGNPEIELLLNMMGFFGAQTGSPALLVAVTDAGSVARFADRNLVVLGSVFDQPLVTSWARSLPIQVTETGGRLGLPTSWLERVQPDSPISSSDRELASGLLSQDTMIDGYVEGFQSPLNPEHSVVMLIPRDPNNTSVLSTLFAPTIRRGDVYGTVSIAQNGTFQSFHIAQSTYRAGGLSIFDFMMLTFTRYYWFIPVFMLIGALIAGVLLDRAVEHHAWKRLNPDAL
jgi:cellulose synthase (UDP-forming)